MSGRFIHRRDGGSVLIVVLWASFGLVSIALLFGHSMLMSYRGADNDLAGRQAELAIDGAARYAATLLMESSTPGLLPDQLLYTSETVRVGEATFWFLGRAADSTTGTVRDFGLVDESAKLNLNSPLVTSEVLMQLPGMTEEFAAAIVEWRSPEGASSAVSGGVTGTSVKHGPFESIEELALVSGATRAILYGEDANMNGVLDPNEDDGGTSLPEDNADGKLDPGLLEYVTVFSKEPATTTDGTQRLNVADPQQREPLRTLLRETFPDRGEEMITRLGETPLTSVLELLSRCQMTAEEAGSIMDKVRGATVEGLVNINTASEAVLALIVGADRASSLVAARLSRAQQTRDMTWAIETLSDIIPRVGPFLTGSSYQVSADVAAVGRNGRGYRRARFVIDMSSGSPKIIYRRNLAPLGWALGSDVRKELALKKEVR
jgi:DNA uptake protein ComE-like DNA-binding protein